MRRNGDTTRERFKNDETECLGTRGEDEHIGEREPIYQFLSVLLSDEFISLPVFLLQLRSVGAVAYHELGAGQVEF